MSRPVTATFWHPYPTYQWEYKQTGDWADIEGYALYESGATDTTVYLLDDAVEGNEGKIRCAAYSPDGQVEYSDEVSISVGALGWDLDLTPGDSKTVSDTTPYPDIYVSPTGNDTTGDGSIGAPYATPQKAEDEATPGTIIEYAAGTYSSPNVADTSSSYFLYIKERHGTAEAPIIHRAAEGAEVVWDGIYDNTQGVAWSGYIAVIYCTEVTHHEFHNITLRGGRNYGTRLNHYSFYNKFVGCTFELNGRTDPYAANNPWPNPSDTEVGCGLTGSPLMGYTTVDGCVFRENGRLPYLDDTNPETNHSWRHDHHIYAKGFGWLIQNSVFIKPSSGYAIKLDGYHATNATYNEHSGYPQWRQANVSDGYYSHIVRNNTFAEQNGSDYVANGTYDVAIRCYCNGEVLADYLSDDRVAPDHPNVVPTNSANCYEIAGAALIVNNLFYETSRPNYYAAVSSSPAVDGSERSGQYPNSSGIDVNMIANVCTGYGVLIGSNEGNLYDPRTLTDQLAIDVGNTLGADLASWFVDAPGEDYRITGGPAVGAGDSALSPELDAAGATRVGTTCGAYEV